MCDLTTIGLAFSVARSIGGALQAQQQYKAQQREAQQRRQLLRRQAINRYDELAIQRRRERAKASRELQESRRESLRAREKARVRAAESGSAGLSLQGLLRDLGAREARFAEGVRDNNRFTNQELELRAKGNELQTGLSLQSVRDPKAPDLLGAAANTFGGLARLHSQLGGGGLGRG